MKLDTALDILKHPTAHSSDQNAMARKHIEEARRLMLAWVEGEA